MSRFLVLAVSLVALAASQTIVSVSPTLSLTVVVELTSVATLNALSSFEQFRFKVTLTG